MNSRASALLLAVLGFAAPCAAQSPGTFEVGGFARYTFFDNALALDDKAGGGGTLGIFLVRNLALEAEGAYTTTSTTGSPSLNVDNTPIRGRLTYHIPLGGYASAIRIGAGYVRNMFGKDVNFDDDGATGLLGLRLGVGEKLAVQVDGTVDYSPSPAGDRVADYTNWGVQGGVVLLLGNSYDDDKDKVKNKTDRCPGTPAGETVDAAGCSASQRDTDRDGVKDSADRCPNTATGATVDGEGCAPEQKDKDSDGVIDNLDKCLDTPSGESVNASGCSASQIDSDGDGVKDNADKCPDTPAGEQVDPAGCAAAQRDSDNDGVMDSADACADTPAGQPVDSRGCSRDSDFDGVPDGVDACPSTPNGQAVDEQGCPKLFEGTRRTLILQGVTFATGKAVLTDQSKAVLRDVAHSLAANPEVRVQVSGHTDNTGSRATNLRLSASRAKAVEAFLESSGVSPAQLTSKGFGPDKPVATNRTAAGRQQNRRVELNRIN
jgi:outer membrane protein OmpA-like peptidoglycan-associated protein